MQPIPLRTSVVGSYPLPGWLEFAASHRAEFGAADRAEMYEDAVTSALHDQLAAGLDVVTDGEQSRLGASHSLCDFLFGLGPANAPARRFGAFAPDQKNWRNVVDTLEAPRGLGVAEEFERLKRVATPHIAPLGNRAPALRASLPGAYTLAQNLVPGAKYRDRWAITEALVPIVARELERLVEAGCGEISLDESAMSCDALQEDTRRFVDIFNRTVASTSGRCRLSTPLCFGNEKSRSRGPRSYSLLLPAFLDFEVAELHIEMASREFAEIDVIRDIAGRRDVSVGIVDVKSDYIESVDDVAARVRHCLEFAPPERLAFAPDCGLGQTARWVAQRKLKNMCDGVKQARAMLGLR